MLVFILLSKEVRKNEPCNTKQRGSSIKKINFKKSINFGLNVGLNVGFYRVCNCRLILSPSLKNIRGWRG